MALGTARRLDPILTRISTASPCSSDKRNDPPVGTPEASIVKGLTCSIE